MADKILCNKSDLIAAANAIRSKLGVALTYYVSEFSEAIDSIPTGTPLPTLTNPGSASDLLEGKQLIDQEGNIVTGTKSPSSSQTYNLNFVNEQADFPPTASAGDILKSTGPSRSFSVVTSDGVDIPYSNVKLNTFMYNYIFVMPASDVTVTMRPPQSAGGADN